MRGRSIDKFLPSNGEYDNEGNKKKYYWNYNANKECSIVGISSYFRRPLRLAIYFPSSICSDLESDTVKEKY